VFSIGTPTQRQIHQIEQSPVCCDHAAKTYQTRILLDMRLTAEKLPSPVILVVRHMQHRMALIDDMKT